MCMNGYLVKTYNWSCTVSFSKIFMGHCAGSLYSCQSVLDCVALSVFWWLCNQCNESCHLQFYNASISLLRKNTKMVENAISCESCADYRDTCIVNVKSTCNEHI